MAAARAHTFSNEEYADMVFIYGFCGGNALAASREYMCRYPNRRQPESRTFTRVFANLRNTGTFRGNHILMIG